MGFTDESKYEPSNGINVARLYFTVSKRIDRMNTTVDITGVIKYRVFYTKFVWANQLYQIDHRDEPKWIDATQCTMDLTYRQFTGNVFSAIYAAWKAESAFNGHTLVDDLEPTPAIMDVQSANNMSLTNGSCSYYVVRGSETINTIQVTEFTYGNNFANGFSLVLQFASPVTLSHATAGTYAQLNLAGAVNFAATAQCTLTLVFNSATGRWDETGRTAP